MGNVQIISGDEEGVPGFELAPGVLVPSKITITDDDYQGYRVEAVVTPEAGRLVVSSLAVTQLSDGAPVTGEGLRQIAIQRFIRLAVRSAWVRLNVRPADAGPYTHEEAMLKQAEGTYAWGLLPGGTRDRLKAAGPTDETLRWVATLYLVAVAMSEPPVKLIQGIFEVSLRTASNWVAAARAAGHLPATTVEDPIEEA